LSGIRKLPAAGKFFAWLTTARKDPSPGATEEGQRRGS
jgi:hypothetical protein